MSTTTCLRQSAYEHIRRKLLTWDPKRHGLLSEVALAKEIGISRTPVREAVSQLIIEGLVERRPGQGVVVKTISRPELVELMDLRLSLETYANGRAARCISAAQLAQLRELVFKLRTLSRQMADSRDWDGPLFRELALTDAAFHLVLLDAAGSPRTAKLISDMRLLAQRFTSRLQKSVWNLARVQRHHWRIYQAVRQGNEKAARAATRRSIVETKRLMVRQYDRDQLEQLPESSTQAMWREAVEWMSEHRVEQSRGRDREEKE